MLCASGLRARRGGVKIEGLGGTLATHMMGATGLFDSAMKRCIRTPMPDRDGRGCEALARPSAPSTRHSPSKTPKRMPHIIPEPTAVFGPAVVGGKEGIASVSAGCVCLGGPSPTSNGETSTGHEARDDGVPVILLLPNPLYCTVVSRKHRSPDTKITAQHRCPRLDGRQRAR